MHLRDDHRRAVQPDQAGDEQGSGGGGEGDVEGDFGGGGRTTIMTQPSSELPEKKLIFCNRCRIETNHTLVAEHRRRYHSGELVPGEDFPFWEEVLDRFWICAGCEDGTLETCYTIEGMEDPNGTQIYETLGYHPKRVEHEITEKRFRQLPKKLDKIYRETIQAYNDELDILCAAGLRALIEGICADKQISGPTLEKKIDRLVELLPNNIVKSLHSFRFIGNTALHELSSPNRTDLCLAIEVSEDLLNCIRSRVCEFAKLALIATLW
jgi:hypothetical protein